jgi:hypothetical protein
MQKRGFPAAAILALFILAAALLVIIIKLIFHQLDLIDRRRSLTNHHHHPLSPSYPNTPKIIRTQSQQLVVEIHRCDDENELNILFVEKISKN